MRGIDGLLVGHYTDLEAGTGCTTILLPGGTTGGVAVPGISPATRETDSLRFDREDKFVHAFHLTGGSAFGLDSAGGVMVILEARGIGHPIPIGLVPIVPTAAILDMSVGAPTTRPDRAAGIAAVEAATDAPEEGTVGAGTGATVGKYAGFEYRMKGGVGVSDARDGDLIAVAIAVANPVGDIIDSDRTVIAGSRHPQARAILDSYLSGEPLPAADEVARSWGAIDPPGVGSSTTIAAIVTNARTTQTRACRLAERIAIEGFAASIDPPGTRWDGDTVFLGGTNQVDAPDDAIVGLGALVLADAIRRAGRLATELHGIPAASGSSR
ncbi:MAG: P1 family peptidase [Actinomycetota bacterium]